MSDRTHAGTGEIREKKLTCIRCPVGCLLTVTYSEGSIISVDGNKCVRGTEYAEKEIFCPERIVTTTVRINGGPIELLPVKTAEAVPREKAADILHAAARLSIDAPVKRGDILERNIAGTGVNLVASRSVQHKES